MTTMHRTTTFNAVADERGEPERAGAEFKRRRDAIGLSRSELAKRAGVDRSRVQMAEEDDPRLRDNTLGAIDRALSALEREMGMGETRPDEPHLIRIKVEGVYGAKALIVEGRPEDQAQLEAMVDRIMRNLRSGDAEGS